MCAPGEAARIPLTLGRFALVDREDEAWVNQWPWIYSPSKQYARRTATLADGRRLTVYLHRAVMRAKRHDIVDHESRDKLDCRKDNLRHATVAQNSMNTGVRAHSQSGVTGVNFDPRRGQWRAYIVVGGKQTFLGYFAEKDEAIHARRAAEQRAFGAFAPTGDPR